MLRKIVNQRIEELRKDLNMTQTEFAVKLGLDESKGRSMINNWEQGLVQVKSDDLIKIARTFSVSADYLLGLRDDKTNNSDAQKAIDYTGLSEEAINNIHKFVEDESGVFSRYVSEALDRLLSSTDFYFYVLSEVVEYYNTHINPVIDQEKIEPLKTAIDDLRAESWVALPPPNAASYHAQRAAYSLQYILENQDPLYSYNLERAIKLKNENADFLTKLKKEVAKNEM